jgi:hypothetical protein
MADFPGDHVGFGKISRRAEAALQIVKVAF